MRFHNIELIFCPFFTEDIILFGQNPCIWIERVLFLHIFLGHFNVSTQQIFPSKLATAREMVDSLIAFESFDELFRNIGIHPDEEDVIEMILFVVKLVVKVFLDKIVNKRVLCF